MSITDELVPLLKKLRMSGVLDSFELRLQEPTEDDLGHQEFLYRLLKDEVERRDAKQLELRVRRANFENQKTLEDFDFHFNPEIPKAKVLDLATCNFVNRKENVLLLGGTGVGKSHIAQALRLPLESTRAARKKQDFPGPMNDDVISHASSSL